jgi:hypothetical protein
MSVLAPEFPDMDVAQFKACVTRTAKVDRDQVPSLSSSNGFTYPLYATHLPPMDYTYKRKACGPKTSIYVNQKI